MILGAQKQRLVMVLAKLLRTSPKEVQNFQLENAGSEKQLSGLQRGSELYSPLSSSGSQDSILAIHDTSSEIHQFHRHGKLKGS